MLPKWRVWRAEVVGGVWVGGGLGEDWPDRRNSMAGSQQMEKPVLCMYVSRLLCSDYMLQPQRLRSCDGDSECSSDTFTTVSK